MGSGQEDLESLIAQAFSRGFAIHGDLDITPEDFSAHLNSITARETKANPNACRGRDALPGLATCAHITDLYLAAACALKTESAWTRLFKLYSEHVDNVAHGICSTHEEAREISSNVLTHLFLPDGSGRPRIASYRGQCALGTWLATIVKNQAINRRELKFAETVPLDSLRSTPGATGAAAFEAELLKHKYSEAIEASFEAAASGLGERERLVLALGCDDELAAKDIARMLGVHPAQITRACRKAEMKFRTTVIECLITRYRLGAQAVEECLAEMLSSHEHWISTFLREYESRQELKPPSIARSASAL